MADVRFSKPILCSNGWEAIEHIKHGGIDVLMTDICMPGISGLDVLHVLYPYQHSMFVVIITGYAEFSYAQRALHYGANEYLLKPVKPEDLHQALANFVKWKAQEIPVHEAEDLRDPMIRITKLIEAHVHDGISLQELADAVSFNKSYLSTWFKNVKGITISEYLTQAQQKLACQYLATTAMPMHEIAEQTGGRTASNFTQWFHKHIGITPKEYRKLTQYTNDKEGSV